MMSESSVSPAHVGAVHDGGFGSAGFLPERAGASDLFCMLLLGAEQHFLPEVEPTARAHCWCVAAGGSQQTSRAVVAGFNYCSLLRSKQSFFFNYFLLEKPSPWQLWVAV